MVNNKVFKKTANKAEMKKKLSRRAFLIGGGAAAVTAAHEFGKASSPFYRYYLNDKVFQHIGISRRANRLREFFNDKRSHYTGPDGVYRANDLIDGIKKAVYDYRRANKDIIPHAGFGSKEMFDVLLIKAMAESRFGKYLENLNGTKMVRGEPNIHGIYHHERIQWARRLALYGAPYIEGNWDDRISVSKKSASFRNTSDRSPGLRLRSDPYVSSITELAYIAEDVIPRFEQNGLKPFFNSDWKTWLYIEHTMGFSNAKKIIEGGSSFFSLSAHFKDGTDIIPSNITRANRSLFYHSNGKPKSLRNVYKAFEKRVDDFYDVQDRALAHNSEPQAAKLA
jgi:hypothetical protein